MNEKNQALVVELRERFGISEKTPRGYWRRPENRVMLEEMKEYELPVIRAIMGLSARSVRDLFQEFGITRKKASNTRFDEGDIALIEKLAAALNPAPAGDVQEIWISYLATLNERRKERALTLVTQAAVCSFTKRLNILRATAGLDALKLRPLQQPANEISAKNAPKMDKKSADRKQVSFPADKLEALLGFPDLPSHLDLQKDPPRTSREKPFRIDVRDERHAKIFVINSPGIGTIADTMHKGKDPLRNALRLARALESDAVLLTGNLVYINWLRYSNLHPFRAKISGIQAKAGITHHPEAVEADSGTVVERVESGKVAFVTFKQKFDYVLSLVKEMCFEDGESGKPVFDGPIYMSFGSVEESLAMWYANEKIAIDVETERRYAALKIYELQKEFKKTDDPCEAKEIERKIQDFVLYRKLFVKMTNVIDRYTNLVSDAMRNYMIHRIEASIPNATVVSVGNTYFEVPHKIRGPWLLQVAYEKTADSITGDFAGRLRESSRESTKRDSRSPEFVLGGGNNPKLEYLRVSYRTRGGEEYEDMRLSRIIQLPTLLDSEEFREVAATFVRAKDKLTKLASRDEFMAGAVFIEIIDGFDRSRVYLDQYLTNPDIFEGEDSEVAEKIAASILDDNMMYHLLEGDNHAGARFSAYYMLPQAKNGCYVFFHDQVVYRFLLDVNAPILGMSNVGDTLQWKNYPTEAEVHPEYLPPDKLILEINRLQSDQSLSKKEQLRQTMILIQKNTIFSGELSPEDQLDLYMRRLRPDGIKFISQMLQYGASVGYCTFGEIGRVTYVHGNHNEHSFPKNQGLLLTESGLIARILVRDLKIYRPGLFGITGNKYLHLDTEDQLEKFVKAPRFGTLGAGTGLFGIVSSPEAREMSREKARQQDEHYLYGRYDRHKQATSKRKSNMKAMQRAFAMRGSVEADFVGRFVINQAGDDHQGGFIIERDTLHIKSGGQLFRGEYGERHDFGLANVLSMVWGVPKNGPHTGPIVVIPLGYEELRPLITNPYSVNGKALFANAITAKSSGANPNP